MIFQREFWTHFAKLHRFVRLCENAIEHVCTFVFPLPQIDNSIKIIFNLC